MRVGTPFVAALTLAGCSYDASGNCRFDDGHSLLLLPVGAAVYGLCKATTGDQAPQPDHDMDGRRTTQVCYDQQEPDPCRTK